MVSWPPRNRDPTIFTDKTLQLHLARRGTRPSTATLIKFVRTSPPRRRTESRHHSVAGRICTAKMARTVSTEANDTELLGLRAYDADDDVVEVWDQPDLDVKVPYVDRHGKSQAAIAHVDFLVLEVDDECLDEWKTDEQLIALKEEMPGRYVQEGGLWRSPAAEEAAARMGFRFRVRTKATVPPEIVLNDTFLSGYVRDETPVDQHTSDSLVAAARQQEGISLGVLLAQVEDATADDLNRLIAREVLYVDLARQDLAATFQCRVYTSREIADAIERATHPWAYAGIPEDAALVPGALVDYSGRVWTVSSRTEITLMLRATDGALLPIPIPEVARQLGSGRLRPVLHGDVREKAASCVRAASPDGLLFGMSRWNVLRRHWNGEIVEVPERTLRRWQEWVREEEKKGGFGLDGLTTRAPRGRPPGKSLSAPVEAVVTRCIEEHYENPQPQPKVTLHATVKRECEALGLSAPSYPTLHKRLKERDRHQSQTAREGEGVAYESQDFYWYLASDTPRHGKRPFERGHVDHTELDVLLVDSETGLPLGRPWITLMIDAHTRRILAYWLTFDPPSYRSTMMVVRRCVERWNRLPEELIVDAGSDFRGIYFENILARHGVDKLERPGEPRFGAVLERVFGTLNTRLIHMLRGNTVPTKKVRSMTRDVDPKRRAVWTLATLADTLDEFLFEIYDKTEHPALGVSPRDFFEARLSLTGERPWRHIPYDAEFLIDSLPTTPKGQSTVSYDKGVKINGRHYRAPEFRMPGVAGELVPVRWDPMDVRHAYAFVLGRWVECWCPALRRFPAISEREVACMSAEDDQRARNHRGTITVSAAKVSEFMGRNRKSEEVLIQHRKDAESGSMLGREAGHAIDAIRTRVAQAEEARRQSTRVTSDKVTDSEVPAAEAGRITSMHPPIPPAVFPRYD